MRAALLLLLLAAPAAALVVQGATYTAEVSEGKLRVRAGKRIAYLHPGSEEIELLDAPKAWAPAFLYKSRLPGLGDWTLHVLRVEKGRVRRVGKFPGGRLEDLDGDGAPEVIARTLPLGARFRADCPGLHAPVTGAYRTEVRVWRKGRFADASAEFPRFFASRVAEDEKTLDSLDVRTRSAEYLGTAIALYYDEAARGEGRRGWEKLSERLDAAAVPGLADCAKRFKTQLRERLEIRQD